MTSDEVTRDVLALLNAHVDSGEDLEAFAVGEVYGVLSDAGLTFTDEAVIAGVNDALLSLAIARDFQDDPQNAYDNYVLDYEENPPVRVGTALAEYWQNFFKDDAERTVRTMVVEATR